MDQSSYTGNIADHMLNLEIHLRKRFLHVLHVLTRHCHQLATMPHEGADRTDLSGRPKCGPQ